MKNEKSKLFKDRVEVNHKGKLKEQIAKIAKILKKVDGLEDKDYILRKILLNDEVSVQEHKPNHKECIGCSTKKLTEKRICRCMYYYNTDRKKECKSCKINRKWKNVGNINITEYEYPTKYVIKNVGGIDLIFDDKYAVEVKPKGSEETLARMFAEILTYTIDYKYKPAICFFEGSKQMRDYRILMDEKNEDLIYICKYIKVFYFTQKEKDEVIEFTVREIEDNL